jgi:hypothetical protein
MSPTRAKRRSAASVVARPAGRVKEPDGRSHDGRDLRLRLFSIVLIPVVATLLGLVRRELLAPLG